MNRWWWVYEGDEVTNVFNILDDEINNEEWKCTLCIFQQTIIK